MSSNLINSIVGNATTRTETAEDVVVQNRTQIRTPAKKRVGLLFYVSEHKRELFKRLALDRGTTMQAMFSAWLENELKKSQNNA